MFPLKTICPSLSLAIIFYQHFCFCSKSVCLTFKIAMNIYKQHLWSCSIVSVYNKKSQGLLNNIFVSVKKCLGITGHCTVFQQHFYFCSKEFVTSNKLCTDGDTCGPRLLFSPMSGPKEHLPNPLQVVKDNRSDSAGSSKGPSPAPPVRLPRRIFRTRFGGPRRMIAFTDSVRLGFGVWARGIDILGLTEIFGEHCSSGFGKANSPP